MARVVRPLGSRGVQLLLLFGGAIVWWLLTGSQAHADAPHIASQSAPSLTGAISDTTDEIVTPAKQTTHANPPIAQGDSPSTPVHKAVAPVVQKVVTPVVQKVVTPVANSVNKLPVPAATAVPNTPVAQGDSPTAPVQNLITSVTKMVAPVVENAVVPVVEQTFAPVLGYVATTASSTVDTVRWVVSTEPVVGTPRRLASDGLAPATGVMAPVISQVTRILATPAVPATPALPATSSMAASIASQAIPLDTVAPTTPAPQNPMAPVGAMNQNSGSSSQNRQDGPATGYALLARGATVAPAGRSVFAWPDRASALQMRAALVQVRPG